MNITDARTEAPRIGLVLPGGGARAAYQAGVLRAIAEIVPRHGPTPFKVIAGTSAGSFNAAALAIHADDFRRAVLLINKVWLRFRAEQVFRADSLGLARSGLHWLLMLLAGGLGRYNPNALLDRSPLNELLERYLPVERIQSSIDCGHLHALGITASSYRTGHSITFFQGHPSINQWDRESRLGRMARIGIDHLLASSAIPFVFSAVRLGDSYYGDGSIRQIAPLSPALHLGADRLLVIGNRKHRPEPAYEGPPHYPSMADIAGHVLDSIFLDSLEPDIERLERINRTLGLIPDHRLEQGGVTLRRVGIMHISPSRRIDHIAQRHGRCLPASLRFFLKGIGAYSEQGATLLSYLLFERPYCRELIELGYHDAMRHRQALGVFLGQRKEKR